MANPDFGRIFSTAGTKDVIDDPTYAGGWDSIVGALRPQKSEYNSITAEQDEKLAFLNTTKPQTWTDSGIVNAYIVNIPDSFPFDLFDGFRLSFTPQVTNTGASTINGAWNDGIKSIRDAGGQNVTSGELSGRVDIVYNAGAGQFYVENVEIPNASTSVRGISELATNAETQAGSDTARVITPAGLTSRTATETRTGILELANTAEAQNHTGTQRAMVSARVFESFNQ